MQESKTDLDTSNALNIIHYIIVNDICPCKAIFCKNSICIPKLYEALTDKIWSSPWKTTLNAKAAVAKISARDSGGRESPAASARFTEHRAKLTVAIFPTFA